MKEPPGTARRHVLIGALIAALVGVLVIYGLLAAGRDAAQEARTERRAMIALGALADVVERAGASGDGVRRAVGALAEGDPTLRGVRVVVGRTIEASTMPGEPAPRDLQRESRDDKALWDQGQRLRAAVDTNRDEGAPRESEIEIDELPDGRLRLAAPVETDGEVAGFVQLETAAPPFPVARPPFWPSLLAVLVAVGAAVALGVVLGRRRWLLLGATAVALVAALLWLQSSGATVVAADRTETERLAAAEVAQRAERVGATLRQLGLEAGAPMDPSSWDQDVFRRPRGAVSGAGEIDQRRLNDAIDDLQDRWTSLVWGAVVLALALLLFFGAGAAARTWRIATVHREAYTYVLPAMLAMLVLVFFPFFYGIALSFTGQTIYTTDKSIPEIWVGLENYTQILGDFRITTRTEDGWTFNYQNFYWTLLFTIVWTVTNVSIGVSVGLVLALILNTKGLRLRPIYRVILVLPWAMPNYITALIWKGMFHQQFGVVNQFLQMIGLAPVSWFESPVTSFATVLATNGWLSFPFMMVISLGALQSIPADLYEAARVDGASRWTQFTAITLPSLKPALVPAVILSVVWTFNMFNIIFLVSGGEPAHSTEILITQAYKLAFEQYRYGYAAAYSTVIFAILLIYGTFQNRVTRATEGI